MNEEELKKIIANKLAYYRKECGMTQAELAEKINYSDKSVSKWERAEGLPDVYVLSVMAELFGVTVNDLITEAEPAKPKTGRSRRVSILVPIMSALLPWLVGTVIFLVLRMVFPEAERLWLVFVYTAAVSAVVLIVFAHIWWNKTLGFFFVSSLVWIAAACVYLTLRMQGLWLIFIVAAVMQVLTILWYLFLSGRRKK
jgi:transcriptional regulator with XRE-family HTH domain